jgi:hypothetical protein
LRRRASPVLHARSYQAFLQDLPKLLKEHADRWVAYAGDKRISIADSQTELIQRGLAQGLTPQEFLVLGIEPEIEEVVLSPHTVR